MGKKTGKAGPKKDKKEEKSTTPSTETKTITLAGATFTRLFAAHSPQPVPQSVATAMTMLAPVPPTGNTRYLTVLGNGITEAPNPAILFMIEDTTPTTNPHINAVNVYGNPGRFRIHVVSVTRNKDESDAQKKAQQSQDLIEKYRQGGGGGGPPATRAT